MIGPFFVFETIAYYPSGGIADCQGIYGTLEEAKQKYNTLDCWDAYIAVVENLEWRMLTDEESRQKE